MSTVFFAVVMLSCVMWGILLLLPWRPWWNTQALLPNVYSITPLDEVTVLIPARNESDVIGAVLEALARQQQGLRVVLVDDGSSDGTADIAREISGLNLKVCRGSQLPAGWSGKLWALEQGRQHVNTPYTLLLDADIVLVPGMLSSLLDKARSERWEFVSIMARLRMESRWEKLLMPAFIYFFKLLYPFELANSPNRRFYAAAGGCILLKSDLLARMGGFGAIRGELIDDCSLAKAAKGLGARTWIGQSKGVVSLRAYDDLETIWEMVARTAFTQLRYSGWLLGLCTFLMAVSYWVPVLGLWSGEEKVFYAAMGALSAMSLSYLPTLVYYRINLLWVMGFPLAATLYLGMTWSSALRYWRGERSRWKNRVYATESSS